MRNACIGYGESDQGQYNAAKPTAYLHGAAMLVKRNVVEEVGEMPELFFLYYEEIDWSTIMTRSGYEFWYEPALTLFHK